MAQTHRQRSDVAAFERFDEAIGRTFRQRLFLLGAGTIEQSAVLDDDALEQIETRKGRLGDRVIRGQ